MSTPADKKIKTWQRAGAVVLALSVWQAASWAVGSALLLPGPVTVLGRLCALAVTAAFRRAVAECPGTAFVTGHFHLDRVEGKGRALPWAHEGAFSCWEGGEVRILAGGDAS